MKNICEFMGNSFEDKVRNIQTSIEYLQKELSSAIAKQNSIQNEAKELTGELISLLSFGKQKEKIDELQNKIIEKNNNSFMLQQVIDKLMFDLQEYGNQRNQLNIRKSEHQKQERELRELIVKSITDIQNDIHKQYNQLEEAKKQIEGGFPLTQFIKGDNIVIGDTEISIQKIPFKVAE